MKSSKRALLALAAAIFTASLGAQTPMPRMTAVEPTAGKVGDILTVSGENLEKTHVAELFLTDGKTDLKVPITEQAATSIKFRIPATAKPGRFALMILTAGRDPKYIEQPVKVTVQTPEEAKQQAAKPEEPKPEQAKPEAPAPTP